MTTSQQLVGPKIEVLKDLKLAESSGVLKSELRNENILSSSFSKDILKRH